MAFRRQGPQDIPVGRLCRFEGVADHLNDRPGSPTSSGIDSSDISGWTRFVG
jgi:hypothetical protein